jgi:cobalamin synthase
MKDSHVGAMGVIAGSLALLMKASLISALYRYEAPWSALIIFVPIWSRWCMMWAIVLWPYARTNGQGLGGMLRTATRREAALGTSIAVAITLIALVLVDGRFGNAAMCASAMPFIAALAGWIVCRVIARKLGGLTGDTYGALNECVECVLLAASVAFAHHIYG